MASLFLFRSKNKIASRVIALAIGLAISTVLFAYIAHFLNTNTYFNDYKNLYAIDRYIETKDSKQNTNIIYAPIPAALKKALPEIESATVCSRTWECSYNYNEHEYNSSIITADSCFFETMGIEVIDGDTKLLGQPNFVFLSDKQAKIIFGDENPIGKAISYNGGAPYTVAGVFKAIPSNCTLQFESVLSFINMNSQFGRYCGWNGGDSFQGYVRLSSKTSPQQVSSKIEKALESYRDNDSGFIEKYALISITDLVTKRDNTPTFLFILNLLATVILLIATFNYILTVLSTLPLRMRSIGVQKSYGASRFTIFKQFLSETACIVIAAACLAFLLIYLAHAPIEIFTGLPLQTLFAPDNLWLPFATLLAMALMAGVIPGIALARAPIYLFFSAKTAGNQFWKKIVLFIQVAGSAIILPLLIAAVWQYNYMVNKPLGYDTDHTVSFYMGSQSLSAEELNLLLSQFRALPYVESVATSEDNTIGGYSGNPIFSNQKNTLFITRVTWFDSSYVPTLGIKMVEGRNLKGKGEIVVNETFAKRFRENQPDKILMGHPISPFENSGVVVGVMADFATNTHLSETQPLLSIGINPIQNGTLTVRVSQITPDRLKELNQRLSQLLSNPEIGFTPLGDMVNQRYESVKYFRNTIGYTTTAILIIVFIGLLGYIDNEIARKTKEIAIRKVNGASVWNILTIISRDLSYAVVPAVIIGSLGAYPIVQYWMEQFPNKADISWTLFAGTGIVLLAVVISCSILKSWHIANGNPVDHLKRE